MICFPTLLCFILLASPAYDLNIVAFVRLLLCLSMHVQHLRTSCSYYTRNLKGR